MANDEMADELDRPGGEVGSDWLPVEHAKFRERRFYLGPDAFAFPGGGLEAPTNLIERDEWGSLMTLPTDVVLQTTDHFGSTVRQIFGMAHLWLSAISPGQNLPLVFDAYLDAYDEFDAAPFIASHGWYRQGTAGLRNALEVMVHSAAFNLRGEVKKHAAWRAGTVELKFGNSIDLIAAAPTVQHFEVQLAPGSLFAASPRGVIRQLYRLLCRFAHGAPGYTNADMWDGSNGPIYNPQAFARFAHNYLDTILACFVLLKIAYPSVEVEGLSRIAAHASPTWGGLAATAVQTYFD